MEVVVPPREGRSIPVMAGQTFSIVDVAGGQVGDLFLYSALDVAEFGSAEHTRVDIGKLFPRPGDRIVSNLREPIAECLEDTSPGVHDALFAACDPARYRALGVTTPHRSCRDNARGAMLELGFPDVYVPQPFNVFMSVKVEDDQRLTVSTSPSRPGDRLVLRAVRDLICVLSNCPMDISPISTTPLSDLLLVVND